MKRSRLWILAGLPLLIGACAPADEETDIEPVEEIAVEPAPATLPPPADEPTAMEGMEGMTTVEFTALADMGHQGTVELMPMGAQTQVMVTLSGPEAGEHAGHIHTGTCDNLGSVVVPLEPVNVPADGPGTSTSTVDVDPATVMDGNHLVAYHMAGGDPGQPVVCASIPAATM